MAKKIPLRQCVGCGEMKGKKEISLEQVFLKPMRNLRHLKGKLKQLLDRDNIVDTEDFIYVTLTDEEIVNDAMGIFQQTYPNTVKIDYRNSHTQALEQMEVADFTEHRSFD